MKKTKAFTLTELLVVMVLSSIVISLTFLILSMVQKQSTIIRRSINRKNTVTKLDRILWQDFNETNTIERVSSNHILLYNERDTISYDFQDKYTLRNTDSFHIVIPEKVFFLDGDLQSLTGYVDAIKLTIEHQSLQKTIFVFSNKDASFYINTDK